MRGVAICAFVAMSLASGAAQSVGDGTAEISGVVVTTAVPPTPLARVLVTIGGDALKPSRTIITDEQGRFAFKNLPGGSFTIVAARPPYVRTAFGAKRPGRPGTPISLAAGQRIVDVRIALARGAAVMGTIRNAAGEPAPGVRVTATPLDLQADPLSARIVTDDRGIYRVFGLPPGKYVVTATFTDVSRELTQLSDAEMDQVIAGLQRRFAGSALAPAPPARPASSARPATYGYAPIHYPGTPDPDQAGTLVLAEGEERDGVDIALQLVRTVALEGRVLAAAGALPSGVQVILGRHGSEGRPASTVISTANSRPAGPDGDFRFTGVLPGRYRVVARAVPSAGLPSALWASADVTIVEDDVSGIALTLQPGLRVSGRVVFDARSQAPPADLTSVRFRLADVTGASTGFPFGGARADGTFEISGVLPGTYDVTSLLADATWWLRSVVVNGRDVLDFPIEMGQSGDVTGAVVTFTDQHSELSGTLQSAANIPAPDYFVVVFSSDRAFWRLGSRRVQFTRPSTDGRFAVRDLPAGDYLIAALTDMEPSDLADATFLENLMPAALPVRMAEGEKKTQDLRLAR